MAKIQKGRQIWKQVEKLQGEDTHGCWVARAWHDPRLPLGAHVDGLCAQGVALSPHVAIAHVLAGGMFRLALGAHVLCLAPHVVCLAAHKPAPPSQITETTAGVTKSVSNPDFELWNQQDQLLLHVLISSTSESVAPFIAFCQNSKQAWDKLNQMFANKSRSRMMSLQNKLCQPRGGKSVSEYLQFLRIVADDLALINSPVSEDDLVIFALNGVGSEYKELAAGIKARESSISYEELVDKMLDYETFLQKQDFLSDQSVMTAHVAQKSSNLSGGHSQQNNRSFSQPQTPSQKRGSAKIVYQYCEKPGHTAKQCYKIRPRSSQNKAQANHATSSTTQKQSPWLADTGASHHVCNKLENLDISHPYGGTDELFVGNGTGLPITHAGSSTLTTSARSFKLHNVLCVPDANTKLVSVSKFCQQNHVSCEFFPCCFLVKDLNSRIPLARGPNRNGVYEFPAAEPLLQPKALALVGIKTTPQIWHQRLGHPASPVLQSMIKNFSLSCSHVSLHGLFVTHSSPQSPTLADLLSDFPVTAPIVSSPGTAAAHGNSHSSEQLVSSSTDSLAETNMVSTNSIPTDFVSQIVALSMPSSNPSTRTYPMITRSQNQIFKPKVLYTATKHPIPSTIEPGSAIQAIKSKHWKHAMLQELQALHENNTLTLVPPPSNRTIIGCKWVFRIKTNPDGTFSRYKARLVAKGFTQQAGLDYKETFSPVVKPVTVRLVLSIAVSNNWGLHQLDVNNAFLQGELTEEIYMQQPHLFHDKSFSKHVCKLNKAIYGLKQAPRAWYHALSTFLLAYGFKNSTADASLFIYHSDEIITYMLVYVDDIIVTGNDSHFLHKFIHALSDKFSLKDLGTLNYFLGVQVQSTSQGLFLSQKKYILDLLESTNMSGAKPDTTPLSSSTALTLHDGTASTDQSEYRRIVGSLQYLSLTRKRN
ncbi:Reverse transcriptase, RNA-dependent DNA polymerase [Corchorus capsularis]|uniref:Reverse transcriptase, RNA-dependent DNA polymerase n=1 Tax=Corchorus capsularis TaxID=210143 RepID=A0A1R3IQ42_COCAP|nr:Reverse transcriptase, RNA-dependent DNA polymerase [Corchorus capsularis]